MKVKVALKNAQEWMAGHAFQVGVVAVVTIIIIFIMRGGSPKAPNDENEECKYVSLKDLIKKTWLFGRCCGQCMWRHMQYR